MPAAQCVTTGLLEKANDDQLRAVMAHVIAHADLGHVAKRSG
jgi:Zn-dependent protease with chaperone function